jgi:hypothetical protein
VKTLQRNSYSGSTTTIVVGIIWVAVVLWLCISVCADSLEELALMQRGRTVPGLIVDTWQDVEESDSGRAMWYHGATYVYQLPDGQILKQHTKEASGRLRPEFRSLASPYPVQVVYLADKPSVSRIKGQEQRKVEAWVVRKAGGGVLFLVVLLTPGIAILVGVIRSYKAEQDSKVPGER